MEKQIAKLMKNLDISREEAMEVIQADKEIDKGKDLFKLNAEQEKASREARQVSKGHHETKERKPKEKKVDDIKKDFIAEMVNAVEKIGGSVEIVNEEREFLFTYNGKKYKTVLSCPRK